MDARITRVAVTLAALVVLMGAQYRTPNFIINTADPRLAKEFGDTAERQRKELAVSWLGRELPNWSRPCPITVNVGQNLGAGGSTTFMFERGEVFGWRMSIQGSRERILDSVLPHEITHMIFASHFRQPLPRWADEGGATSVEHVSEKNKHRQMLYQFLRTGRGIAFNRMFAMRDYPPDIMPLYAQAHSVAQYLISKRGRRAYVAFVGDGLESGDWQASLRRHYDVDGTGSLQQRWLAWVERGSPPLPRETPAAPPATGQPATAIAAAEPATPSQQPPIATVAAARRRQRPEPNLIHHIPSRAAEPYAPGSVVATGWHAPGERPTDRSLARADSADSRCQTRPLVPVQTHQTEVTRPQPTEGARQLILQPQAR
jgi:hypothetical protein